MFDEPLVQIHHLELDTDVRYTWDKDLGAIQRTQQLARRSTVGAIAHEGHVYEVRPDLSFLVPASVASFMTRMPNWHYGPSPLESDTADGDVGPFVRSRRKVSDAA